MGYIPQESLENLKKYSYKGVDKWAHFFLPFFLPRLFDAIFAGLCSLDMS